MKIQGLIFDLDGTLLQTLTDIANSANEVLAEQGFPLHPVSAYGQFVGDGVCILMRRAAHPNVVTSELIEQSAARFEEVYLRRKNECAHPYDGILELLDAAESARIPAAVLSNKPHPLVLDCIATFFEQWNFVKVLGQSSQRPCKPDPEGALEIARAFGADPAEIICVGDMPVDMETARNAGMVAAGVSWGFRPDQELQEAGADFIVHHPRELIDVLDSGYPIGGNS